MQRKDGIVKSVSQYLTSLFTTSEHSLAQEEVKQDLPTESKIDLSSAKRKILHANSSEEFKNILEALDQQPHARLFHQKINELVKGGKFFIISQIDETVLQQRKRLLSYLKREDFTRALKQVLDNAFSKATAEETNTASISYQVILLTLFGFSPEEDLQEEIMASINLILKLIKNLYLNFEIDPDSIKKAQDNYFSWIEKFLTLHQEQILNAIKSYNKDELNYFNFHLAEIILKQHPKAVHAPQDFFAKLTLSDLQEYFRNAEVISLFSIVIGIDGLAKCLTALGNKILSGTIPHSQSLTEETKKKVINETMQSMGPTTPVVRYVSTKIRLKTTFIDGHTLVSILPNHRVGTLFSVGPRSCPASTTIATPLLLTALDCFKKHYDKSQTHLLSIKT